MRSDSLVVDVGAGIGAATFAAAAMGVRVLAVDPVLANVLKICDGIHLNRARSLVQVRTIDVSITA